MRFSVPAVQMRYDTGTGSELCEDKKGESTESWNGNNIIVIVCILILCPKNIYIITI